MSIIRKDGTIVADSFVRIADDAAIPADTPVLLSAGRFLAGAAEAGAPMGVVWPNNRRVAELAPHFHRLALVVLNFPSFRDGRAYSQARQLREEYAFRGELRATGEVLRDQFLFMLRAGFDSLEVRKDADISHFAEAVRRYSVFYQPAADGRVTAAAVRRAHADNKFTLVDRVPSLDRALEKATPEDILREAIRTVPKGRLALVSSFGIESAALLKIAADVDRSLAVIFLDTGWLFGETLAYRDALVAHLGLTDVRTIRARDDDLKAADPEDDLWSRDPDACCHLRKVAPLTDALSGFDAWITGRKRYQGGERSQLPIVEFDGAHVKFNPFARISPKEIAAYFRAAQLPRHPLAAAGFASIGCMPCSSRARTGEGMRDGRWRGQGRSECGIHLPAQPAA